MLSYGMQERTLVAERDIAIKEKQELDFDSKSLFEIFNLCDDNMQTGAEKYE